MYQLTSLLDLVLELDLVADGKLEVGGRELLGDLHDLVSDELSVLEELVIEVDVVVSHDQRPKVEKCLQNLGIGKLV